MMARHGSAWAAKINGNAYRDYLTKHPKAQKITLTRPQMEAIIRDLCEYSDRDAEATAWAEQATRSAARIAELEAEVARLTELLTGVQEAMMHASERIAEVEDWLVLVRDGAQPVGSVVHEIAACKEAYWYLWDAPSAKALHSAAIAASEAPGAACDMRTGKVVSVHDTAAHRATDDERGTP